MLLLKENYGTITQTMKTLFQAIAGGNDWYELYRPLHDTHESLGIIFYAYIFFMVFGVLNVVTSLFVDAVYRASQKDPEIAIQTRIEAEQEYVQDLRLFFKRADKDGSMLLSYEEFSEALSSREVQAFFNALNLDGSQAGALFSLLDKNSSREISIEEFIEGCVHLRGEAKSLDVAVLLEKQSKLEHYMKAQFHQITDILKKSELHSAYVEKYTAHGIVDKWRNAASTASKKPGKSLAFAKDNPLREYKIAGSAGNAGRSNSTPPALGSQKEKETSPSWASMKGKGIADIAKRLQRSQTPPASSEPPSWGGSFPIPIPVDSQELPDDAASFSIGTHPSGTY